MRDQSKPGVNWAYAKDLYEATDLSLREIAQKVGKITYYAVIKKAQKEGWIRAPMAKVVRHKDTPSGSSAVHIPTAEPPKDGEREPLSSPSESLPPRPAPLPVPISDDGLPNNPRNNMWVRSTIITALAEGMSQNKAADLSGAQPSDVSEWRKKYPEFDRACLIAQQQWHQRHLNNINKAGDRGDWKASLELLRVNAATKDDYRPVAMATGNQINVILNIARPEVEVREGQTIDATFVEVKDGSSES